MDARIRDPLTNGRKYHNRPLFRAHSTLQLQTSLRRPQLSAEPSPDIREGTKWIALSPASALALPLHRPACQLGSHPRGPGVGLTGTQLPALPLTGCVALRQLLNSSEP